ncbi:xanthine dehydrogenase family protein molybdopterin-binding subunit [Kordiimonas laminariae]|uniref:xanthine dehydrogenase family protein molybdopterin-binding subunit n=1 Tax=Kordiimonas laminariae TaxID=2917717 RepID=UPI001FF6B8F8|nr:xanthine dehydrogenase family protein molybdopterin-binding subunit [Kordiimonas laminariae]MCK0068130.1 xanthine dehydrogenase family protein molybdopterin-binding subunit [Kordiimonas laminariae]
MKNLFAPKNSAQPQPTRRQFILSAAAGVLTVSLAPSIVSGAAKAASPYAADFLEVAADGTITVIAKHFEMGQGTTTGLATIVAEELGADWNNVMVRWAPADVKRYQNIFWGAQGTGGSSAMANSYMQLRQAGAAARYAFLEAASKRLGASSAELVAEDSMVKHKPSGKSISFGDLTTDAAGVKVPEQLPLKDSKSFKLFGKHIARQDSDAKTDGSAIFAQDVKLPGMLKAVIARSPYFGGTLKSFDATEALKVQGVVKVIETSRGVAVLAKDTWAAMQGREMLDIQWNTSGAELRSSPEIMDAYLKVAETKGTKVRQEGNAATKLAEANDRIEATYQFPFLAHAPMEALNAVAHIHDGMCEIWAGSQFPTIEQATAAAITGLPLEKVEIHTVYAGGSFGRRATPNADYIAEAVEIAHRLGDSTPVHLVWSREDDIRGGRYRPVAVHKVSASVGADGMPEAWEHTIVTQSILKGTPFEPVLVKDGIDSTSVEGVGDTPYPIPNLDVSLHSIESKVPGLWWRSVGHTHTGYVMETMIDACAKKAGVDALDYRIKLLKGHKRHSDVLAELKAKSRWGKPLGKNKARGVAVHESFGTVVGHVVEISRDSDGYISIDHVTSAVDCGLAVNPDVIEAQVQSSVVYGLSAVMQLQITLDEGLVEQDNFPSYEPMRISQMPEVEVHIVKSSVPTPTGIGEPGVPPIGPAFVNALTNLTGETYTKLPLAEHGVDFA